MKAEQGSQGPGELQLKCTAKLQAACGQKGEVKSLDTCASIGGCIAGAYMNERALLLGFKRNNIISGLNRRFVNEQGDHLFPFDAPSTIDAQVIGRVCGHECIEVPEDQRSFSLQINDPQSL